MLEVPRQCVYKHMYPYLKIHMHLHLENFKYSQCSNHIQNFTYIFVKIIIRIVGLEYNNALALRLIKHHLHGNFFLVY